MRNAPRSDESPRYRPRRLRRPDERIEFQTTNPTRPADRFVRYPAPPA